MSFIYELRASLTATDTAAEATRAAGTGLWASYCRSVMWGDNVPICVDALDAKHTEVVAELEAIAPLTKSERSSLTSAKCVIKNAVANGKDVWRRDALGLTVECDEEGRPMPRGKNDLQDDKSDFEKVMKQLQALEKKVSSDTREHFTSDQLEQVAASIKTLAVYVGEEMRRIAE